jgi:hypothetical protein
MGPVSAGAPAGAAFDDETAVNGWLLGAFEPGEVPLTFRRYAPQVAAN